MPNCKFCGKPVKAATVFHSACWETQADKMAWDFCDNYCKWPGECKDYGDLDKHCDNCALIRVLNLGV